GGEWVGGGGGGGGGGAPPRGPPVPTDRRVPGRVPARYARMDRAQPSEAGSSHAAHPGTDGDAGRRPATRPGAWGIFLRDQTHDDRGSGDGAGPDQRLHDTAPQAAPGRGRQRHRAVEYYGVAGP